MSTEKKTEPGRWWSRTEVVNIKVTDKTFERATLISINEKSWTKIEISNMKV
jgi:hypothetical protein